jgi:hypothetical protein
MWERAQVPELIADVADNVNRLLTVNAHELGESRETPARRLWFHRPVCVLFVVDTVNCIVYVAAIRWIGY